MPGSRTLFLVGIFVFISILIIGLFPRHERDGRPGP